MRASIEAVETRSSCGAWIAAVLLAALACGQADPAAACDLCAVYSATELRTSRTGLQLGVGQQFTRFEDVKDDGKSVPNPQREYMNSSITQLLLGYNSDSHWGAQLNVPIISRTFRRGVDGGRERGSETGFGDLSLTGLFRPYRHVSENSVLTTTIFGGLKFPSGSADRLREERTEVEPVDEGPNDAEANVLTPHRDRHDDEETSGIHGHDLALGTGSVDGIIGGRFLFTWERFFWTTMVQYTMRTKGSFDYRVQWRGGPGAFLLLHDDYALTAQFLVSGERKGMDELDGAAIAREPSR